MKSKEEIEKHLNIFYDVDRDSIQAIIYRLQEIVEVSHVDEELLRSLENIEREVQVIQNKYFWRILELAKKGHMID